MAEKGLEQNCDGAKPEEHEMRLGYYVVLLIAVLATGHPHHAGTEELVWCPQIKRKPPRTNG